MSGLRLFARRLRRAPGAASPLTGNNGIGARVLRIRLRLRVLDIGSWGRLGMSYPAMSNADGAGAHRPLGLRRFGTVIGRQANVEFLRHGTDQQLLTLSFLTSQYGVATDDNEWRCQRAQCSRARRPRASVKPSSSYMDPHASLDSAIHTSPTTQTIRAREVTGIQPGPRRSPLHRPPSPKSRGGPRLRGRHKRKSSACATELPRGSSK